LTALLGTIGTVLSVALILGGVFFLLVSTTGLLRLPDFLSRAHAVGKSDTLGSLLVLTGLAIHNGWDLDSGKLFLIVLFIAVTNPTGIHTLARAALRAGGDMWVRPEDRDDPLPAGEAGALGPADPDEIDEDPMASGDEA
jgi:multicomponent Na+:H+ antiporter subunit G